MRKHALMALVATLGLTTTVASVPAGAQQSAPATPMPRPTSSPLPYPAYGTPAPDVIELRPKPNVPEAVNLPQAVDIAVVESPEFFSERAAYEQIRAKYYAEKSALFPNISGLGTVQRTYGPGIVNPNGTINTSGSVTTTLNGSLSFQQLIYDGGRVIAAIKSAKESDIAGRDTLLRNLQTLQNNVAHAYYTVLANDALVHADALLVHEFEVQENNVRASIHAGVSAQSDLASAQFQTARARGSLVSAQGALIASQSTFATILGLEPDALIVPQNNTTTSPAIPETLTYAKSLEQALLMRPDYIGAEHTVTSASQNLRFAKLARFPALTANGNYGVEKTLPSVQNENWHNNRGLGAQLQVPIFDQGQTNFNVAVAASQLDQASASLRSTRLGVESDVRSGLASLISAKAALVQAQSELNSAQVSLNAASAQYKVGVATIVTVVTAQANLSQAQSDFVAALYGERIAEENYNFAVGLSDLKL